MSFRLALGGLGLTAVAVLVATGCRAARPGALDDAGYGHRGAHGVAGGQGLRLGTPAPHAAPPAVRAAPQPAPTSFRTAPHAAPTAVRGVPPGVRHLPALRPRRGWRPAAPPVHACSTVSLGPGRGRSVQCVQRSDEVITRSDDRAIHDDWPDRGWTDRDRGGRDWPDLGLGRDD